MAYVLIKIGYIHVCLNIFRTKTTVFKEKILLQFSESKNNIAHNFHHLEYSFYFLHL